MKHLLKKSINIIGLLHMNGIKHILRTAKKWKIYFLYQIVCGSQSDLLCNKAVTFCPSKIANKENCQNTLGIIK